MHKNPLPPARTVFNAALLVGTLDLTAAFIQIYLRTGRPPFQPVLHFIAKAVVGKNTMLGNAALMAIGVLTHYFIATTFTAFFFFTAGRLAAAKKHWLLTGFLYGLFVWAVMNLAVLPLTGTRKFPHFSADLSNVLQAAGILMVCIGIPLAFLNRKRAPAATALA